MKILFFILMINYLSFSDIIYRETSRSLADTKVFVTDNKSEATHFIYKTESKSLSKNLKNIWYFTNNKSEADIRVYFVNNKSQADIIVYFSNRSTI